MANYQKAIIKLTNTQIKICSKKQDRENIKNK